MDPVGELGTVYDRQHSVLRTSAPGPTIRAVTGYLFSRPSFLSGVARLVDLWGAFDRYNFGIDELESDARATYSDWRVTGEDIARATAQFERQVGGEQGKPASKAARK